MSNSCAMKISVLHPKGKALARTERIADKWSASKVRLNCNRM
nr:MAG TPA: hypothetical protein [Caudoviricetes sp.]